MSMLFRAVSGTAKFSSLLMLSMSKKSLTVPVVKLMWCQLEAADHFL